MQVNVNMNSGIDKGATGGASMRIGELAGRFGLAPHVLRHWETMGLLTPAARVNGRRRYTRDHLVRVATIVRGKAGGLSLDQLRELLNAAGPAERRDLLREQLAELDRRLTELRGSRALVEHALSCPAEDFTRCGGFQRMVADLSGLRDEAAGDCVVPPGRTPHAPGAP